MTVHTLIPDPDKAALLTRLIEKSGISDAAITAFRNGKVEKIEIYPQDARWDIYFNIPLKLDALQLEELEAHLLRHLPMDLNTVKIIIRESPSPPDEEETGIIEPFSIEGAFISAVKKIKDVYPSFQIWFKDTRVIFTNDSTVEIFIPGKLAYNMLKNKKSDTWIEKYVNETYSTVIRVILRQEDRASKSKELPPVKKEEVSYKTLNPVLPAGVPDAVPPLQPTRQGVSKILMGGLIKNPHIPIRDIRDPGKLFTVKGVIVSLKDYTTRQGKQIITLLVTDYTDSIYIKLFDPSPKVKQYLIPGNSLKIAGKTDFESKTSDELVIMAKKINLLPPSMREDKSPQKRIELNVHTRMSSMSGLTDIPILVKTVKEWGHSALGICDRNSVQGFPQFYQECNKNNIKPVLGMEAAVFDNITPILSKLPDTEPLPDSYVVFDLETTGIGPISHEVTEIGAVRIDNGTITGEFSKLVKPKQAIRPFITHLTGISNDMVDNAPSFEEVLPEFMEFARDTVLVAHHSRFDTGFIKYASGEKMLEQPVIDSVPLCMCVFDKMKNYKLKTIAGHLNISMGNHHRALDDARTLAKIMQKAFQVLKEKNITTAGGLNELKRNIPYRSVRPFYVCIYPKNRKGLERLYELCSTAHLDYFYKQPRLPLSDVLKERENLLIGSPVKGSEIYDTVLLGGVKEEIEEVIGKYDFIFLPPQEQFVPELNDYVFNSKEDLYSFYKKIINAANDKKINLVASSTPYYLEKHQKLPRNTLLHAIGFDIDKQPDMLLNTTDEMLKSFSFIDESVKNEIVINSAKKFIGEIEDFSPIPDGFYPPQLAGDKKQMVEISRKRLKELYGDEPPEEILSRYRKELDTINEHGFAVLYYAAHLVVKKSIEMGYPVGSRGSVGSSFLAYLMNITEVNPLPPHTRCPGCKEVLWKPLFGTGIDVPRGKCKNCDTAVIRDGFDIPFEVFVGFDGTKVPDIDLNFSGEIQLKILPEAEKLFGKEHVFRAGTVSTIKEKTARMFVKKFMEERQLTVRRAEIERLATEITGVKRTTGQHPGGMVVIPADKKITEFTPVQYPANEKGKNVITTHFDYHVMDKQLVKLDLLGHDVPTQVRLLKDLTGVDPLTVPLDDPETMKIYSSTESLNLPPQAIGTPVGTLGIPEYGTEFVRGMLKESPPKNFSDLLRISGLSHGTDVWLNNARDLILQKKASLPQVISLRGDIMNYLIRKGVPAKHAFDIMERVRKSKAELLPEDVTAMKKAGVPLWYIQSAKKIKYLFPRAHAVAYVLMAFRIAYFKVHYPESFYASYYTINAGYFDYKIISGGKTAIKNEMKNVRKKINETGGTANDKHNMALLEVANEMWARRIPLMPIDIYYSDAKKFGVHDGQVRPALMAVKGLGGRAAERIVEAREGGEFKSIEDLIKKTSLNRRIISELSSYGVLDNLPPTNQIALL